jgi:hypothetical protein
MCCFGFTPPADVGASAANQLHQLDALTPGDFAVLRRQHLITPFSCGCTVIEALDVEIAAKESMPSRRIGFI